MWKINSSMHHHSFNTLQEYIWYMYFYVIQSLHVAKNSEWIKNWKSNSQFLHENRVLPSILLLFCMLHLYCIRRVQMDNIYQQQLVGFLFDSAIKIDSRLVIACKAKYYFKLLLLLFDFDDVTCLWSQKSQISLPPTIYEYKEYSWMCDENTK